MSKIKLTHCSVKKIDGISIKGKSFELNTLKWVLKARSKDPSRLPLQCVLVEDDKGFPRFTCTDGRRLNSAIIEMIIEPGTYDVVLNTAKEVVLSQNEDVKYPNYKQVIPNTEGFKKIKNVCSDLVNLANFRIAKEFGVCVDYKYLADILSLKTSFDVYNEDELMPVVFKDGETMALLMPLRID